MFKLLGPTLIGLGIGGAFAPSIPLGLVYITAMAGIGFTVTSLIENKSDPAPIKPTPIYCYKSEVFDWIIEVNDKPTFAVYKDDGVTKVLFGDYSKSDAFTYDFNEFDTPLQRQAVSDLIFGVCEFIYNGERVSQ